MPLIEPARATRRSADTYRARRQFRESIRNGSRLYRLVDSREPVVESMIALRLVRWVPECGPRHAERLLIGLPGLLPLRGFSERERRVLVSRLRVFEDR